MKKKKIINLIEVVVFTFAYFENAERVASSLCRAGFFVNIKNDGKANWEVLVYAYF